jgi:hypothetical protein
VSKPRISDDARNQENREEERRKGELITEIRALIEKHGELLASISNI